MQLTPRVDSTGTLQSLTATVGGFELTFNFPKVLDASHIDGTRLMALVSTADYFYDTPDSKANHASNTFRFAEILTSVENLPEPELDALIEDVFTHLNQGHLMNAFLYAKLSSFKTESSTTIGFVDEQGFEPLLRSVHCADNTIGWVVRSSDLIVVDKQFRGLQDQLVSVLNLRSHVSYFVYVNEQSIEIDYYDRRVLTGNPNTLHTLFVNTLELEHHIRCYLTQQNPNPLTATEPTVVTADQPHDNRFGMGELHFTEDAVFNYAEVADADYREMAMQYGDIEAIEDGEFEEIAENASSGDTKH
jgi:hypothetical protein